VAYGPGQAYPQQPAVPAGAAASVWYPDTGPSTAGPAVNPSWLASTADRERTVGVLRAGFAEGRLTQDELSERVARAYAARTYADLWALTADLPAGPLPYPPQAMPYQQDPALQPGASPPGNWHAATALIITALVIFTLAALVTAIATAHAQPMPVQQVHVPPYYVIGQGGHA